MLAIADVRVPSTMLSRAHSELLIDILSWMPNVLAVAGVAFAFWLVAAEGINLWTALVMVGTAAIPGTSAVSSSCWKSGSGA